MAAGGQAALVAALEILEHEIKTTMALAGASSLAELTSSLLERSVPIAPAHVLSAFPLLEESGY